ncbi:MAG: DUF2752 domain-containing protein [Balneolaceae bacterium]
MENLHKILYKHLEWTILLGGMILLAWMDPYANNGFSLCLLDAFNIYCPGDGLGHSISFIFRGLWLEAWQSHPAGFLAVIVITWRIYHLTFKRFLN